MKIDFLFRLVEISLNAHSPELYDYERVFREWDDYVREYANYTGEYEKSSRDSVNAPDELRIFEADEQEEVSEFISDASRANSFSSNIVEQDHDGLYFKVIHEGEYKWLSLTEFDEKLERYVKKRLKYMSSGFPKAADDEEEELTVEDLLKFRAERQLKEAYALLLEEM